jgi:chromate transport protein ChrA
MKESMEEYIDGLKKIRKARETDRKNIKVIVMLFFSGGALALVFPPAIILALIAVVLFWYSFYKTAKVKCPRCNEPFASNWSIPLGYDVKQCQNCKLSYDLLAKHEGTAPKSHTDEWFQ